MARAGAFGLEPIVQRELERRAAGVVGQRELERRAASVVGKWELERRTASVVGQRELEWRVSWGSVLRDAQASSYQS